MKIVKLGKTGLEVSRLGMGGIPITRPSERDAMKVIHRAFDLGVNSIDTDIGYGISEQRIGKGIVGRRDQVQIATTGGGDKVRTLYLLPIRELIKENDDFFKGEIGRDV